MIYLKTYRMFESMQDGVTPQQRELLNSCCQFYQKNNKMVQPEDAWWVNPETGLVDVGGNFILGDKWKDLMGIKFGRVNGYFNVVQAGLEDPNELPREIGTHLNASYNKFRTLEGIGKVGKTIDVSNNLLVSLEGMTLELLGGSEKYIGGKIKAYGNPVRYSLLNDDLEEVLKGETTWTAVYLAIVAGEYGISKDPEGSIGWIVENKLDPEALGAEIRKAPEKMAIELAKVNSKHKKALDDILNKIDLPPGFRDDTDLVASLRDVGLD